MVAASAVARAVSDVFGSPDLRNRLQPRNTAAVPVLKSASSFLRLNDRTAPLL